MSGGWSTDHELLALLCEITFALYRTQLVVGGVKKHRLPQPFHIPRPEPATADSDVDAGITTTRTAARRRHATTAQEVVAVLAHGFGRRR